MWSMPKVRVSFAVLAVAMMAVVGCGSDSDSSSSSASSTSTSNGNSLMTAEALREVQSNVQAHLPRPTSIGITEPVKSVPKGKTVYHVYTEVPTAIVTADSGVNAAKALGWTLKRVGIGLTPEALQGGMDQALRDPKTDAIIVNNADPTIISKQLAEAESKKIPVVNIGPNVNAQGNMTVVGGPSGYQAAGQLEADYVLNQTKGDADMLLVIPSAFSSVKTLGQAFEDRWAEMCPKCKKPRVYDAPATSFGTNFPALLTAYLQANRSVDYVMFGFSDMLNGIPNALKASGLSGLRAVSWSQGPVANPLLGKGFLQAQAAITLVEYPWYAYDQLLRRFNNQPVPSQEQLFGPGSKLNWIINEESLAESGLPPDENWPLVADYAEQFKRLWGVE